MKKDRAERELIGWKRKEDPLALAEGGVGRVCFIRGQGTLLTRQIITLPTVCLPRIKGVHHHA